MKRRSAAVLLALMFGSLAVSGVALTACVGDDPGTEKNDLPDSGGGVDAQQDTSSSVTPDAANDTSTCERCGGSACVDTMTDSKNCGGCGKSCTSDAGVSFACVKGACGNDVVQVAAGYDNECVVLSEGSVWCWGASRFGQLGKVNTDANPTPTKIAIDEVTEARVGKEFICARKRDGSVWCWGDNTLGILGHAPGTDPACAGKCTTVPTKITIPNNAKIAQLSAALGTVCGRTEGATGGDVYCWGNAFGGITGDATVALGTIKPPTKIPVFTGDVMEVSLGSYDTGGPGDRPIACAIRNDRTVWCWGVNHSGGLGHSGGTDITCTANAPMPCNGNPIKVEGLANIATLSVGGTFACATTPAGALSCWGNNSNGYLGSGNTTSTSTPAQVLGLNTTTLISAGDIGVLALDSTNAVKGWGANGHGQLALGSYVGAACVSFPCHTTAQSLLLLQGVKQLSLPVLAGIALKTDGTVVTWGGNGTGELGHAPNTNGDSTCGVGSGSCNPTPAPLLNPPWKL